MKAMSRPPAVPRRACRARGRNAAALALAGGATVLLAPAAAVAAVSPTQATLQARIDAVRAAWARRDTAGTALPAQGWTLAQAANWTNWPKWSKWSNWANK